MTYYFVSWATDQILDILFVLRRKATKKEIEAVARPLANLSKSGVYVLKGEDMGLKFEPCHKREENLEQ